MQEAAAVATMFWLRTERSVRPFNLEVLMPITRLAFLLAWKREVGRRWKGEGGGGLAVCRYLAEF